MKRRALLASCAGVAIGGCLGSSRGQRLAWIWLQNEHAERYQIDVAVEDDGETEFSDAIRLLPGDEETADVRLTDPVEGRGRYTVSATIDGEILEVDTSESSDDDRDCVGVRFTIREDGSVESATEVPEEC